ncbi:hypothetical protein PVK06_039850 [Gossypium arboreum]|uniref:Aminotransferase-like plant mobile domain-containing protein n=1 Tax=Gossypium arboreum TaxID=29729 RepID=A0ABR0N3Z1_GOSAR|nr:hypothetical protein PVK06_039850 [Gossypium arboreum]
MPEDRISEMYIRNLSTHSSFLIEPYLRDVGFLYVARIGRGCKLNPTLVSTLVERWGPETHTFHISCGKCTITFESVQLQLGLLMDGPVVTRSVATANWRDICKQLVGRVPYIIFRAQIEMN